MDKRNYLVLLALLALSINAVPAQNNTYSRSTQSYPATGGSQAATGGSQAAGTQSGYPYKRYSNGSYPYANQPGYGYYGASPYAAGFPALGAPVAIDGGLYRFNTVGGYAGGYWRSPSGYYYPWGAGSVYAAPPPIIMVNQGSSQPALPPVPDMLKDMSTYVDEQNTKKKLKPDDYQHLARRVKDLVTLEASDRSRNNGVLDPADEETLRKDCAMLTGDISRRIQP